MRLRRGLPALVWPALAGALVALAAAPLSPAAPASAASTSGALTLASITPGSLDVVAVDPAPGAQPPTTPQVARPLVTRTYAQVGARLTAVPDRFARAIARSTVRAGVRPQTPPSPLGRHTLTVLPVYWGSTDGTTPAQLASVAQAAATYWAEQSAGGIVVAPTVRAWQRIPDPGSCDESALWNGALAAHAVPAPTSPNQHVLVYFPTRADCDGWAGLASVGGSRIWVNGYPIVDVLAHEFGHNLGLGHANLATCTTTGANGTALRVAFSNTCTVTEYEDDADVMGLATDLATGNLNTALADQLGLVRTVTASAANPVTVDLAPLANVTAVRAVKIALSNGRLYLDFRPAVGRDVREPDWAGVQAHWLPDDPQDDVPSSQLLDLRAPAGSPFAAVSAVPGVAWAVPGAGVTVTVTAVGATATVKVTPTASSGPGTGAADTSAPSAPGLRTPADGAVLASRTVAVSWNPAVDAESGITGYRVLAGSTPLTDLLPAGTTSATVRLPEGTTRLGVVAVNGAGLTGPAATRSVTIDTVRPAAPSRLTVDLTGRSVRWTAPGDAGTALAYLVTVDGGTARRVTTTTIRLTTVAVSSAGRPLTGRHTISVRAVDRAGNLSPAASVTVRLG